MDDVNNKIEFTGKSGKLHTFMHLYNLSEEVVPGSEGIYVFVQGTDAKTLTVLDVQLLLNKAEVESTVERMKEDGATHAFSKHCSDELGCDADIDDIKSSDDYRRMVR